MARNFVISVERVAVRPPPRFVVSVEIVAVSRPPLRSEVLHSDLTAWEEHFKARQEYSETLRVWSQSERLVTLGTQRTAEACYDTAGHASETAHHVRRALARAVVGRMNLEEELAELLEEGETCG